MTEQTEKQFVYKDANTKRPIGLMLLISSGLFLLLIKYNIFSLGKMDIDMFMWFPLAVGLFGVLFSSDLTVIADKSSRILRLHYKYLLFQRTKEIPFDDIADIQAHSAKGNIDLPSNANEPMGKPVSRLVAILKDGTKFFLRRTFTDYGDNAEVAADLRFAITGSRQSDVLKVKPTEFILPLKITPSWWLSAIYIFGIVFCGVFAAWAFSSNAGVFVTIEFAFFVMLSIYGLVTCRLTIEVDQGAITVSSPPYGTYRIYWREVQYIETNGARFAFIGDDKQLVIALDFIGKEKREFLAFFDNLVQERQIEVRPITKTRIRQKNTKVS